MGTRLLPHNQPIAQALMIPFVMVVNNKFLDGPSQGPLAEQNEPLQASFLDGSDKPLGVGIQFRRARWQFHGLDPTALNCLQKLCCK
jgi:hypothetical protein